MLRDLPQAHDAGVGTFSGATCVFVVAGGVAVRPTRRAGGNTRVMPNAGGSRPHTDTLAKLVAGAVSGHIIVAGPMRPLHAAGSHRRIARQPDGALYRLGKRVTDTVFEIFNPPDNMTVIRLQEGRKKSAEDGNSQTD